MFDSRKVSKQLEDHQATLNREGVGLVSRMCFESLAAKPGLNDLQTIHAEEGAKFFRFVQLVAPPRLVGDFIRETCAVYPPLAPIPGNNVQQALQESLHNTHLQNRHPGRFCYEAAVTCAYIDFTARSPDFFLACAYLTLSMRAFFTGVASGISDAATKDVVLKAGGQMNARNFVSVFPIELCNQLESHHGKGSSLDKIDVTILRETLKALGSKGLFQMTIPAAFRDVAEKERKIACPMQAYLFDLLVTTDSFQSIVAGIGRLNRAIARDYADRHKAVMPELHANNQREVVSCFSDCYRALKRAGFVA